MTAHEATTTDPAVPAWLHGYPHAAHILRGVAAARPLDDDERSTIAVLLAPAVEQRAS
jgi:hypothetical protein